MTRLSCCDPYYPAGNRACHSKFCPRTPDKDLSGPEKDELQAWYAHPAKGTKVPLRAAQAPQRPFSDCDMPWGCEDATCHRCVPGDYFMGDESWEAL